MMDEKQIEYLGDGVYVAHDGFGLWVLVNDHINPTDKIYLEPEVLEALTRFATKVWRPPPEEEELDDKTLDK